jgi:hypothetical protein
MKLPPTVLSQRQRKNDPEAIWTGQKVKKRDFLGFSRLFQGKKFSQAIWTRYKIEKSDILL